MSTKHTDIIKSMAVKDDMKRRPRLFKFLSEIHDEASKSYKDLPYDLVLNLFWESMSELTVGERNTILDYFIFQEAGLKSAQKYGRKVKTVHRYRLRVKKRLFYLIFKRLEVESILKKIRKGQVM